MESVKHACQTTIKKLQSCLLSASSELDKMKNDIKTEVLARVVKGKTQKAEPQRRKVDPKDHQSIEKMNI